MKTAALENRILEELRKLRAGTTMCPGKLSVNLGARLAQLRSTFETMARAGQVVLSQKGRAVDPAEIKGPFRIAAPVGSVSG